MSGGNLLRTLLDQRSLVRAVGVHDPLTAILAERAGFEAVWAGGLGICSANGLPDAGLLTMTELHTEAARIRRATAVPVVADVDSGFGDTNVVGRMVRLYEEAGVAAVCIEDKCYPKRNSFRDGNQLDVPSAFAAKIAAAKSVQFTPEFMVIARLESLIAGAGIDDALARARLYLAAGADAILIHSRAKTVAEVAEFCRRFRPEFPKVPVIAIPTTYYSAGVEELRRIGLSMAIYANQMIRAMTRAGEQLLASLAEHGSTAAMEQRIASLDELFELVGTQHLVGDRPWDGIGELAAGR